MSAPQKTIGGRTFSFGMLSAKVGFRVQIGIIKVIGEPLFKMLLGSGAGTMGDAISKIQADPTAFVAGMGLLSQRLDADEMDTLAETLFGSVRLSQTIEGKAVGSPVTFETFQGKPKDIWLVMWEALRVNFADFFPAAGSSSSPSET